MQAEPPSRHLFVVMGAGASYDCASDEVSPPYVKRPLRPPLVTELFDGRFMDILNAYPRAAQIAPSIRLALRSGVVGLEDYLEDELRLSPHQHLREAYWEIPLYLQHLFLDVSTQYTTNPDNYDRLITCTLKLDRVTFITLNYDTILDNRLAIQALGGPNSMDWYIDPHRRWSLVKLHGSINWRQRVLNAGRLRTWGSNATLVDEFEELGDDIGLDSIIEIIGGSNITAYRGIVRANKAELYFPTLAVPVRTKEQGTWCPPDHLAEIEEHQTLSYEGINLLVIGYRAIDEDVLSLFRKSRPLRSLLVVDKSKQDAMRVVERFCDGMDSHAIDREGAAFEGDFCRFAQSDALDEYVASI